MDPNQIINHFQHLNRTRIARLGKLVSPQQQSLFKLLPFLFHTNSSDLPGYAEDCPIGIIDYQADDDTIHAAEKLNTHFKYKRQGIRHFGLAGLYLINEYGLLSLPQQPTFHVHLIHNNVTKEQFSALQHKSRQLVQWAKQVDITLDIQLYGLDEVTKTSLPAEQLEQLYLNGLVLGGGIPLWWLIPPGKPYQLEAESILQQRLLTHASLIDFGDLKAFSAQQLLNITAVTLNEQLESGLTGLLHLRYLQHCLHIYPQLPFLSEQYKAAVYEGEREPLNIDPTILQFKTLMSDSLKDTDKKLIQQALYVLGHEAISKRITRPKFPWRRDFFSQLTRQWDWPNHEFQLLDQRDTAHFELCQQEHLNTHQALLEIQADTKAFCQQQLTTTIDLTHIAKRLNAFSDNKPYLIKTLPAGLSTKQAESEVHLYRFSQNSDWKLSLIPLNEESQQGLYQHPSLLHLLAWAILNGLLIKSTRILIADKTQTITINTVIALAHQLLRSDLTKTESAPSEQMQSNNALQHVHLFINLEQTPSTPAQQEIQLSSLYNDPLNYANRGETLVHSIDCLFLARTGEWQTFKHTGKLAPLKTLETLIPWWLPQADPTISCWCPAETYGQLISQRISDIYHAVSSHYLKYRDGNFLIQIANSIYKLNWQPEGFDITDLNTLTLPPLLSRKTTFSNTLIDRQLDKKGLYRELLSCQETDTLSLIIEAQGEHITTHLIDEKGNLFTQADLKLTQDTTLAHYQQFLRPIQQHNPELKIRYFTLSRGPQYLLTAINTADKLHKQGYLPVVVTMETATLSAQCQITCGPKIFSGSANEQHLFIQVADYILSLRKDHQSYPLYINELNFTDTSTISTLDYLKQKQYLENQLNRR